ncbi:DUF4299 family protein [Holdemanella porci]|uniref:DUF4299 family protein n=1 Tax=Holdemanella porci TaxID=2652276 RepID=UPI00294338A4|nr:DUF4299 family protein [Holdemanella porci]
MSVTARIKQKSLFKKKMNLEDIIKFTGLSYGVCDENYRLNKDEIGEHTLIYDETKLARGFELWLEGSDVLLSLSLPTAPSEIRLFYSLVEKLCNEFNTKKYLREDEEAYLYEDEEFIKWDEEASIVALEDMTSKTEDEYRCFEIFGIYNPISIGQRELQRIDCNLNNLEEYLNEIQSLDVYYATPSVYRKKDTNELFGIYSIVADIPCVVPNKPYIILDQIKGINYWYVMIRKGMTVTYDDFINHISSKEYYDANHIIALLNDDEIDALIEQYSVEI